MKKEGYNKNAPYNKNMPFNRDAKRIGGSICDMQGMPMHDPKTGAEVRTSASPRGNTSDEREMTMKPSAESNKMRAAANKQTSEAPDMSYPG